MNQFESCGSCALRSDRNLCRKFKIPVTINDGCTWHVDNLYTCEVCGSQVLRPTLLEDKNNQYHYLCADCSAKVTGSCAICSEVRSNCAFQTNPSQLPLYVMQQSQRGGFLVQQQVMNPDRIAITCQAGCPCYDANMKICRRQEDSGCSNIKRKWELKEYEALPET